MWHTSALHGKVLLLIHCTPGPCIHTTADSTHRHAQDCFSPDSTHTTLTCQCHWHKYVLEHWQVIGSTHRTRTVYSTCRVRTHVGRPCVRCRNPNQNPAAAIVHGCRSNATQQSRGHHSRRRGQRASRTRQLNEPAVNARAERATPHAAAWPASVVERRSIHRPRPFIPPPVHGSCVHC